MNFFEHQEQARRNTRVMIALYVLAVLGVVAAVDAVIAAAWLWSVDFETPVPRALLGWGAAATVALIAGASLARLVKLRAGGEAVARMAGARPVAPDTGDPLERRLLNVVEEMAIAAGMRVPKVYVMDAEQGINAFAAGLDVSNAVVAVTRGSLETLTRDELQGVVGHEFSHILNGDMSLNLRMVGVLAGIVFIGALGTVVMRGARSSRSRDAGGVALAGLALFIVGYTGLFFARLIKAAVSRQREFLADAAAVQFTRNPEGIAGALDKIRRAPGQALLGARHAEDLSHLFFGQAVRLRLGGLLATHPPLEERIRRIRPAGPPLAAQAIDRVGSLDAASLGSASRLIASLPAPLADNVHRAPGAAGAILALVLAREEEARRRQLEALGAAGLGALAEAAREAEPLARGLGTAQHLPVIDLALPALKAAGEAAGKELLAGLEALIRADRRVSLHEFVVLALVREQLAAPARPAAPARKRLRALRAEAATLVALLAHAGGGGDAARRAAGEPLGFEVPAAKPEDLTLGAVGAALHALKALAPLEKARLVKALFLAASADGAIRPAEADLLRLVGGALDCPLPPLALSASS